MRTTTRSGWLGVRKTSVGCAVVALSLASWAGAEAAVLKITPAGTEIVPEEIAAKAKAIKSVRKVERYLLIKASPHQVIGVEGEAPSSKGKRAPRRGRIHGGVSDPAAFVASARSFAARWSASMSGHDVIGIPRPTASFVGLDQLP